MRADYFDSNSMEHKQTVNEVDEQVVNNGQGSDSDRSGINGVESMEANGDEKVEADKQMPFDYVLGLKKLLGSSTKNVKRYHKFFLKLIFFFIFTTQFVNYWETHQAQAGGFEKLQW